MASLSDTHHVCGELSLVVFESDDETLAGIGGEDNPVLSEGVVLIVAVSDLGWREIEVAVLLGTNDNLKMKQKL